jgi:hypothetical protein
MIILSIISAYLSVVALAIVPKGNSSAQSAPSAQQVGRPFRMPDRGFLPAGCTAFAPRCRRTPLPASGPAYMSSSAVQYIFLWGEVQNETRMALRSRLASASGIEPAPSTRLTLPASRCSSVLSVAPRSAAVDRPGSTPRRILAATPGAGPPSGVRRVLKIRSIRASSMARSLRARAQISIRKFTEKDKRSPGSDPQMPVSEYLISAQPR